jgi:ribosome biogenesis GTPase
LELSLRPHTYDLDSLGWTPTLAAAFEEHADDGLAAGRVGGEHRGRFVVYLERGERLAEPSGRLRRGHEGDWPAVGDWVVCRLPRGDGPTVIDSVLPRTTAFLRDAADLARRDATGVRGQVVAANVDLVVVVSSIVADLNLRRLERYLASAWSSGAQPAIVLTKIDLCEDVGARVGEVESIALGVPIVTVSNVTGQGVEAVRALVGSGRTAVLVGSSGVGKSSLLNGLVGTEVQAVREIRADGRGRHTTTHRELFLLPGGGLVLDTPGMRVLPLWNAEEGLVEAFDDVASLAARCRFSDCAHAGEPGCAVRAALESGSLDPDRLESHRRLERELAFQARRHDKLARSDERRRHRAINRELRRRYRDRPGR